MPSFHIRSRSHPPVSPEPVRPATPQSTASRPSPPSSPEHEMHLKGVKRIVSGLKRRISSISLRGHRHHDHDQSAEDARPSSLLLDIIPGDHPPPTTLPITPRSEPSIYTLDTGAPRKAFEQPSEAEDSSSELHSRSTSDATTSSAASFHEAHSEAHPLETGSSPSSPKQPHLALAPEEPAEQPVEELVEEKQSRSNDLSARFPPFESLTAPIESLSLKEEESISSERSRKYSLPAFESLSAPIETLVLSEDEVGPALQAKDTLSEALGIPLPASPVIEPWEIALPESPVIQPWEIALPESPVIQAWEIALPHLYLDLEPPPPLVMDPLGVSQPASPEAREDVPAVSVEHVALVEEPMTSTLDSELSSSMEVKRDTPLVSPPAPVGEPEVPNPFIEDPDASSSDDETSDAPQGPAQGLAEQFAASEIELALPVTPRTPVVPDLNKSVPPTPALPSDDEDEEEIPELYLPSLTLPTMFLPIPNTDPLSTLLTKYIPPDKRPPRDLTGDYVRSGGEIHPLVMTNSWRAIARQARDRIVEADPEEVSYILSLWYLRLSSLARMRLFNQTSAECTNLFTVLHAIEPPDARAFLFDRVLPFELDVLYAKLKYWAGDHMGYLDALAALLQRCKRKARAARADAATAAMWTERGARVCLIIASQLVEMKDFAAAARILEPLCVQKDGLTSPALRSAVARVYLQGGHISMAAQHLAAVAEDPTADPAQKAMNAALFASAEGDWARAEAELRGILAADPENFVAVNNLAVALLNQGKLKEGIEALEAALRASPATIVTAEPFLFNLSTLYELRSAAGADKKRDLLIEVAKWAGDGLRTTCLKMPTN
ncbi:hypothetical protein BD311DRAFT_665670 [Dichomitus squalens]|uniref:Uncharacterized protein n=1 Tax=Dichomitus squalens TaxID=114155 RepID=A0A4Q9MIG9_9APHY|nr:hypothetical protein BD311DRAFT_665670 [Dichomitus squalens]